MRAKALLLIAALAGGAAQAYPLDATERTGIRRLEAARAAQLTRGSLPAGALLPAEQVRPSGLADATLGAPDPAFSAQLVALLGDQRDAYALAVLDFSDPERPRFGAHQPDLVANVGSVGKVLVLLAWLQRLAELYPDDLAARERILRETSVQADDYILNDEHKVPVVGTGGQVTWRPLRVGDRGNLWEYLDWMMSASSNAAASMVMKELVAIQHLGRDYSADPAARDAALVALGAPVRGRLLLEAMVSPLVANGLDPQRIRQGSLFTGGGKARVPGTSSYATPRELLRLLALIEAGELVDPWSSAEAKRMLYMTQRRIRYASHPVLNPAAVYFKSGSLYSCQPEPGFVCRKYQGNKLNRLGSVALVEYPAGAPALRYAVALMSNVLRVNSAVAPQTLALRIHRLVESAHLARPAARDEELPPARLEDAEGRGPHD